MSQGTLKGVGKIAAPEVFEYEFGPFRVRTDDLILRRGGEPMPLAPKVIKTLLVLLEHAGRVVSKDEMLRSVWGDAIVEEANLSQNIYTLRRHLEAALDDAFIETLPRRGYRFTQRVVRRGIAASPRRLHAAPAAMPLLCAAALVICGAVLAGFGAAHGPLGEPAPRLTSAAERFYSLGWLYYRSGTPTAFRTSVAYFRKVELEAPNSPLGYAGQAVAFAQLSDGEGSSPAAVEHAVRAEDLAARAVALDENSADAIAARGFVEFDVDGNNDASAADLRKAVTLDPQLAQAHLWYGAVLLWQGNLAQARRELEHSSSIDATLPSTDYLLAWDFYLSRDYKDAVAFGRLARLDPWTSFESHLLLAAAYEEDGQYESAIVAVKNLSKSPTGILAISGTLAHVYASMGKHMRARQELDIVERLSAQYQQRPVLTAVAYIANGRADEAFAWLSRLSKSNRTIFALDPRFDSVRGDRRFARWLHG